jgi:hypothetical protein
LVVGLLFWMQNVMPWIDGFAPFDGIWKLNFVVKA